MIKSKNFKRITELKGMQETIVPASVVNGMLLAASRLITNSKLHECLASNQSAPLSVLSKNALNIVAFEQLLEQLNTLSSEKLTPELLGFYLSVKDLGSFGQALITSPTWKQWLMLLEQHHSVIGMPPEAVQIHRAQDDVVITFADQTQRLTSVARFYSGVLIKLFDLSSKASIGVKVSTEALALLPTQTIKIPPCNVLDCAFEVTLTTSILTTAPRFSNRRVHHVFLRELENRYPHDNDDDVTMHIQKLVDTQSSLERINQQWVAEKLHMSERNLLRKLNKTGVTFRELFNRLRSKRALDLLFTGAPIADIAQRLGYSERATFERAFKSWQGITPVAMQSRFSSLSAERKIERVISPQSIPVPNLTLLKLISLMGDDAYKVDELAKLIETDPVLTSKVLSVANSALYGYKGITSIKEAIIKALGTQTLQAIAITILSTDVFGRLPAWFSYSDFWFRSLGCAHVTQALIAQGETSPESNLNAYLTALLHNIGEIALVYCLTDAAEVLYQEGCNELAWFEQLNLQRLRLGVHAIQVTETVLNVWGFPVQLCVLLRQTGLTTDFIDVGRLDKRNATAIACLLVGIFDKSETDFDHTAPKLIERFAETSALTHIDANQLTQKIRRELEHLRASAEKFAAI